MVEEAGLEFWPLAGDPHKLSAHMVETGGRLLPLSADEVKAVPEKQQMLEDIMRSTLPACIGNEDEAATGGSAVGEVPFRAQAIISNPVTYGHIHVAEYLDVPLHLMFPQVCCGWNYLCACSFVGRRAKLKGKKYESTTPSSGWDAPMFAATKISFPLPNGLIFSVRS